MANGFYGKNDIRRDGLLKAKKLKERDAIANPKPRCQAMAQRPNSWPTETQCRNKAKDGGKYCHVHA